MSDGAADDASDAGSTTGAGRTQAGATTPVNRDEERAQLALGLTERSRPELAHPSAKTDAELYRQLRPPFGLWWRAPSALYTQPLTEMADGLHVESMPHVPGRGQYLLAERLGEIFSPPSKAQRIGSGTVLRQPDPVRHVCVRPSHPGMLVDVELARARASLHLVDAASWTSGTQHSLQVSIGLMQLHDHPLFGPEHVLQRRLRSLAEQLGELHQRETLRTCQRRVLDLRNRLEPHIGADRLPESRAEVHRISALCIELLEARRARDEHECAERLLARRMLQMWQDLKRQRRQQGFASTRAKLQVQLVLEDDNLEAELEEEVQERRLLHQLTADDAAGDEGPDAPTFDEGRIRTEAMERQQALRRSQDEETLVPVYTEDTPPTDLSLLPAAERRRQIETGRVLLYPVLLVDNRVVGTAAATELHAFDFCARFDFSLQLQLLQAPHAIALQLWQRRFSGLADFMIAEVFLAVPDVASPAAPRWQHYDFASDRTFTSPSTAVAANEELADGEVAVVPERCLCGQVAVSIAWAAQPAARATGSGTSGTAAQMPSYASLMTRGDPEMGSGALDTLRVRHHVRAEDLDPNAPQDVPLLALLSRSERSGHSGGFRAHRFGRELQLMRNWLRTDRLQLLQLRRERPHEWQMLPEATRAVPQRDAEIPARMRELLQGGASALSGDDDAIDSRGHQSKIRAWMKQVMAKQQRAKTGKQFLLTTKDVVKEPLLEQEIEAIDFNALLEKAFSPRRKLLMRPRPRKPQPGSSELRRKLEVVVVEGVDLPMRAGAAAALTRLYVECSFQGQSFKTEVKSGANPIWNQRLNFDLVVPNGDWSQPALMNLSADVSFNLFDRMELAQRDDRDQNVRTLREEQRWLGSFTLPFSTLYRAGEVKGVFMLSTPPILLGYSKDARSTSKRLVPNSALQLFVTIDPLLPPLKASVRERYTSKDASMQEFATAWIKQVRSTLPRESKDREITIFAPTSSGERALVSRFVRPQPPPPAAQMPSDERTLLRFCSLIPYLDDATLGASLDVWNTTKSFLELVSGDAEEHALLLCNWLLAKGKKAYVLLGTQLPEGETAYVLTRDGGEARLWDASKGIVYSRESASHPLSACPLTSIGCVFDDTNVWANVQPSARPFEMTWLLSDAKCWRPFFGKGGFPQPRTLQSVQAETLEYHPTTKEYCDNLEREVEDKLQFEFEDLRGHRPTDWNRSLAQTLKKLLKRFELDASGGSSLTQAEHDAQLERVQATYQLVGFPIHVSYTDINPLKVKLRNTNLWMSDSPKIQFALTAYVHAYPNNVCSVWVYVAALHSLR